MSRVGRVDIRILPQGTDKIRFLRQGVFSYFFAATITLRSDREPQVMPLYSATTENVARYCDASR